MATKKGAKTVIATHEERLTKPIRLDLTPKDHERLDRQARRRGLTMASFARMVILERLEVEDGGGKS
jgi:hypothetical protein